jgi:hypothetical protein
MAGRACHTEELVLLLDCRTSYAIEYVQVGAKLSPLVRSRFEVQNIVSLLLWS